jgi:serine phosphatase RsbU (regulator of sigma subunit)
LIDFKDTKVQVGTVVALIAAISVLRMIENQTGPLFLIPVALAALWLGRWTGLVTGVIASLLTRITLEINGAQPEPTLFAELVRLAVYGGVGYMIGLLSESRLALERELLRRELELEELRTLQEALAPGHPPERPSLELATCYVPAEHGVSGDFYVVVPARDGATLIAVGDVAGRGLDAAKRAWYVRTLIVSSADHSGDPATVLERANRTLIDDTGFGAPFVTAACMLFHPDGGVEWALAGHNDPVRLDRGLPLQGDGNAGLPLGIADSLGCTASRAQLDPGEGLLLYTDGLTEARRMANGDDRGFELFGEARIERLIADLGPSRPEDLLFSVRRAVHEFSGGRLADDLCMVALRRNAHSRTTAL